MAAFEVIGLRAVAGVRRPIGSVRLPPRMGGEQHFPKKPGIFGRARVHIIIEVYEGLFAALDLAPDVGDPGREFLGAVIMRGSIIESVEPHV